MRSEKKKQIALGGLVFLLLWFLIPEEGMPVSPKGHPPLLRSGDLLPHLSFPNLLRAEEKEYLGVGEKGSFSLTDIEARVLVISFLNTNCVYCIKSIPVFKEIFQEIDQDQNLRNRIKIFGIGAGDTSAEVAAFKEKHAIPYPIIADTEFKAHRAVNEPTVPFVVVTKRNNQGKWGVATVRVGLTFSAKGFVAELKAILEVDPIFLKLN